MLKANGDFRFPISEDLGPGLISSNVVIKAPKSLKINDEELSSISEKLLQKSLGLFSKDDVSNNKKKTREENLKEKFKKPFVFPNNFKSEQSSSWAALRPIDPRFTKSYVSVGVGSRRRDRMTTMAEKDFVEKTKKLLLNSCVIEDVEKSAPGDKALEIAPIVGRRQLKRQKKEEREKTKGKEWFDMAAPELTPELQNELDILKMRSAIDPTRFYKKSDATAQSKYFQIGHVIDAPADYYSNRVTKKDRKRTLVDELMADAEFKKYSKKKYVEIIAEKNKTQRRRFNKKKDQKKGKKQATRD